MDLALTARMMGADEAERAGLVSRVVPADKLMEEALDAATVIASMSLPSVMMARNASTAPSRARSTKACCSSAACSIRCSPPRTRRKAWPPSSRSANRTSNTVKACYLPFGLPGKPRARTRPRRARFFARLPGQRRPAAGRQGAPSPGRRLGRLPPALRLETSGQHLVAGIGPILERRHTRRCRAKGACPYWQALRGGSLAKQHQQGALHA